MKQTLTCHDFLETFRRIRLNQFSPAALRALFEHLEECERDTGEEYELDVIALCCDFAEYESATEAATDHGWQPSERHADADEVETAAREWLEDRTTLIPFDGGVVVQAF